MNSLVLLSGGLDSSVALVWAMREFANVRAISFYYGQAHSREVDHARTLAANVGVDCDVLHLCEAVRGLQALSVPEPGASGGISLANLPGKNITLLSVAASHAARLWPNEATTLVVGCNADDCLLFPDCNPAAFVVLENVFTIAYRGIATIRVRAPWYNKTKTDIVRWAQENGAIDAALSSLSCYAGGRCGSCDACTLRRDAMAANGITDDGAIVVPVCGGDSRRQIATRGAA